MFNGNVGINTSSMLWDMYFFNKIITEIFLVHNIFQYLKQNQLEDQVVNKKQLQKVTVDPKNSAFTCPFWDGELTYVT